MNSLQKNNIKYNRRNSIQMKKVVLFLAILMFTISFTSCKSIKGGCGLTSDAAPIHKIVSTEKV